MQRKPQKQTSSHGPRGTQLEHRRPKWRPGGPNGVQEAQLEPRSAKWFGGGPNGAQEVQMEPRRPKWSPGGSNEAQEAILEVHLLSSHCFYNRKGESGGPNIDFSLFL